jgi:hypothetical protein
MGAKESYSLVGEGNPTAMIVANDSGQHERKVQTGAELSSLTTDS